MEKSSRLKITTDPWVQAVFDAYPQPVREKLWNLRRLILEVASEVESIWSVEETLKWGEPSYLVRKGSTVRIDWKAKAPDQYAMYFKCTSQLVPTFKTVYPELFQYEGNRAIVFTLTDAVPERALKQCIAAALRYHSVKQLPLLGMV